MKSPKPVSKELSQWNTTEPVSVGWMKQFRYFAMLYPQVFEIEGDIVECGLGEGNTFSMLAYFIGSENKNPKRTLWGFDSFEGFPEPDASDFSPRDPKKGEWKVGEDMIYSRLKDSGLSDAFPDLDIKIKKGFLGETLPSFPDRQIAFLHVDVDLYEGYRDALRYIFPNVVKGGLVLFDEYKEFPNRPEYGNGKIEKWPGCTKAVDEYLNGRPEKLRYYPETAKYYLIKES